MNTTQDIDFPHLTLKDALDLAVLIEEEARDRYEEFADQLEIHHTPEAAAFFRSMARNEERHRAQLADRRWEVFGLEPRAVGRANIFDVEAPEYDEARAFMTTRQALETALRCELKAREFFTKVLPGIEDAGARALLEELRDEETRHSQLVEHELAKEGPATSADEDDYEDPPTSQ